MVSSTYYFNQLPAWVTAFNNTRPADKFFGAKWERLLPETEYVRRAGPDAPPWEISVIKRAIPTRFRTRLPAAPRLPAARSTARSTYTILERSAGRVLRAGSDQ
jgi:hypothetical protein